MQPCSPPSSSPHPPPATTSDSAAVSALPAATTSRGFPPARVRSAGRDQRIKGQLEAAAIRLRGLAPVLPLLHSPPCPPRDPSSASPSRPASAPSSSPA